MNTRQGCEKRTKEQKGSLVHNEAAAANSLLRLGIS